ncbi:caspase, EACC1-associated type [Kibdelosporangium phytohabitans]|uniref:Peptidase C14 caspase domain-containing protein n=1 Tax=Kibdelosporangium phytohabitans TaxID=860235 RepID=A0A0N9I6V1_9PSEU|nr:caspase family protein [Kibdelosporangium phytohabitans]ALG10196.1 hypothetical protein AOZ06_27835 [Kibdelosporangium phytohabitans]MBE1461210.1 WD40 repeat protein [Kibdelosporangium phytohabitans]
MSTPPGPPDDSRAVLIGVSAYEYPEFPAIPAARNSVEQMRELLTDPALCGWPADWIEPIVNPLSANHLAGQLTDLAEATTGVLLLYYAGHGTLAPRGDLCLTVTSTRSDRPKITGLPWETVAELLRASPARVRIVILDCCFAGQAIEALAGEEGTGLADITHVQGVYTLTATTRNRTAHVLPIEQQDSACTSFTGELRDLIRTGLPDKPSPLTLGDIYPVLRSRLQSKGLPTPNQRGTDTAGQFPLARNAATAMPVAPRPPVRPGPQRRGRRAVPLVGSGDVYAVAFSPDGLTLASAEGDGTVRLWVDDGFTTFRHTVVNPWAGAKSLEQVVAFNPRFAAAVDVAFSPDGTSLAVANGDGTISLWDIATGVENTLPRLNPVEWNTATADVAFHPSGEVLASTYDSANFRMWDLADRPAGMTLNTGSGNWVGALVFDPSGAVLATASGNGNRGNTVEDGRLQLWDTATGASLVTLAHTNSLPHSLAYCSDGKTFANLRNDGIITLWDVRTGESAAALTGNVSGIACIAAGPGDLLASGSGDGTVTLWDTADHKSVGALSMGAANATIRCLAVSPDGKTVAAGGAVLTVWRLV